MTKRDEKREGKRAKKGSKSQGKLKIPLDFETAVKGLLAVRPTKKKNFLIFPRYAAMGS